MLLNHSQSLDRSERVGPTTICGRSINAVRQFQHNPTLPFSWQIGLRIAGIFPQSLWRTVLFRGRMAAETGNMAPGGVNSLLANETEGDSGCVDQGVD